MYFVGLRGCSSPGENARSWEALGEARPGQSSLSAALPLDSAAAWATGKKPVGMACAQPLTVSDGPAWKQY